MLSGSLGIYLVWSRDNGQVQVERRQAGVLMLNIANESHDDNVDSLV